jgi:hypothetical protein
MTLIQEIYQHWEGEAAIAAAALSSIVHGYQIIVQAGGVKNIWSKFLNGDKTTNKQP